MSGVEHVRVEENVLVARVGDRELRAEVFRPARQEQPAIGILMLPGGGWRNCDRSPLGERYGFALAEDGYVMVAGEYRVTSEAQWPAQIHDVKAGIRWMRANHEYLGIDPSLIVIAGKSAGGHLALLAAGTPNMPEFEGDGGNAGAGSEVAAVVGSSPVSDIAEMARNSDLEPLFGPSPSEELLAAANPMTYIDENYPPSLVFHGTADINVHHSMTEVFCKALERSGVPFDLHMYAGQDHFFDRVPPFRRAVTDAMGLFIGRYVGAKEPAPAANG